MENDIPDSALPKPLILPQPRDCNCGVGNIWPSGAHAPWCVYLQDLSALREK